jgi:hypothetical protein
MGVTVLYNPSTWALQTCNSSTLRIQGFSETVHHFLLVCPKYEKERDKLRKKVGVGGMKLEKLLGDHRRIKDALEFIESAGRFEFWFRVLRH